LGESHENNTAITIRSLKGQTSKPVNKLVCTQYHFE